MNDKFYEDLLNIKTQGHKKWTNTINHPYEATSYKALDMLIKEYPIDKSDSIVDFGCGKGRSLFFLNHFRGCRCVGIDFDADLIDACEDNKLSYLKKGKSKSDAINFYSIKAQDYDVCDDDNKFYFFNPFSVKIFAKVIENVLLSFENTLRDIDIILYYPSYDYIYFLENQSPFILYKEIKLDNYDKDLSERFLIYRLGIKNT